jgi:hypothetical protein
MTLIMLDVKTTFGNIVRDQSVSICMLQCVKAVTVHVKSIRMLVEAKRVPVYTVKVQRP